MSQPTTIPVPRAGDRVITAEAREPVGIISEPIGLTMDDLTWTVKTWGGEPRRDTKRVRHDNGEWVLATEGQ